MNIRRVNITYEAPNGDAADAVAARITEVLAEHGSRLTDAQPPVILSSELRDLGLDRQVNAILTATTLDTRAKLQAYIEGHTVLDLEALLDPALVDPTLEALAQAGMHPQPVPVTTALHRLRMSSDLVDALKLADLHGNSIERLSRTALLGGLRLARAGRMYAEQCAEEAQELFRRYGHELPETLPVPATKSADEPPTNPAA